MNYSGIFWNTVASSHRFLSLWDHVSVNPHLTGKHLYTLCMHMKSNRTAINFKQSLVKYAILCTPWIWLFLSLTSSNGNHRLLVRKFLYLSRMCHSLIYCCFQTPFCHHTNPGNHLCPCFPWWLNDYRGAVIFSPRAHAKKRKYTLEDDGEEQEGIAITC